VTDEEYRELLDALGRRHLRLGVLDRHGPMGELHHLAYELDRLSSLSRFVKAVAERSEDRRMYRSLGDELGNAYIRSVTEEMERAGVVDALDDAGAVVFQNLRRSAIPEEDREILRRAGVEDPEAEISPIVHCMRHHVGTRDTRASTIATTAEEELKRIAERLQQMGEATEDHFKSGFVFRVQ
jgi:predicted signal transduction protein with EAL and GGDEF domain